MHADIGIGSTRGAGVPRIVIFMRAELGSILVPDNNLECFEYPKVTPLCLGSMHAFERKQPEKIDP